MIQERTARARTLLETTTMTIEQVATASGFSSADCLDDACINREALALDEPPGHATTQHRFEYVTQQIAIANASVTVL